jgi:hypothetical protein
VSALGTGSCCTTASVCSLRAASACMRAPAEHSMTLPPCCPAVPASSKTAGEWIPRTACLTGEFTFASSVCTACAFVPLIHMDCLVSDVLPVLLAPVCCLYCCVQVISTADIALYGGFTALASFDRPELRTQVRNAQGRLCKYCIRSTDAPCGRGACGLGSGVRRLLKIALQALIMLTRNCCSSTHKNSFVLYHTALPPPV